MPTTSSRHLATLPKRTTTIKRRLLTTMPPLHLSAASAGCEHELPDQRSHLLIALSIPQRSRSSSDRSAALHQPSKLQHQLKPTSALDDKTPASTVRLASPPPQQSLPRWNRWRSHQDRSAKRAARLQFPTQQQNQSSQDRRREASSMTTTDTSAPRWVRRWRTQAPPYPAARRRSSSPRRSSHSDRRLTQLERPPTALRRGPRVPTLNLGSLSVSQPCRRRFLVQPLSTVKPQSQAIDPSRAPRLLSRPRRSR